MGGMPIEGQKMSDVTLAVRGFVKGIAKVMNTKDAQDVYRELKINEIVNNPWLTNESKRIAIKAYMEWKL